MKPTYPLDDIDEEFLLDALAGHSPIPTADRLNRAERIWLVGKLTERGETIPSICSMLRVSRRTAQRLRAIYYRSVT